MTLQSSSAWPELNFSSLQPTLETLHQWIQIIGKIRLRSMPWQNHSWHTALYIGPSGFTTQPIPYDGRIFQIDLDLRAHKLFVTCSQAGSASMELYPRTVADFYRELFEKLRSLSIDITIHGSPNEMEPAIPFAENTVNKDYNKAQATALWLAMLKSNGVFQQFRSDFIGKASPVHLFWGAFDLAVTRFSGRAAPVHPGGMPNMPLEVMQEAYSREVSSAGFWPGSADFPYPVYYAYAYPADERFGQQQVLPKQAFYSNEMGEFFLKYEDVQRADDPEDMLLSFLQSTYEAAANTYVWDRTQLERGYQNS